MRSLRSNESVDVKCDDCNASNNIKLNAVYRNLKSNDGKYRCNTCAYQKTAKARLDNLRSEQTRNKMSKAHKLRWSKNYDYLVEINRQNSKKKSENVHNKWLEHKEEIHRLYTKNRNVKSIAQEFNISIKHVYDVLGYLDIHDRLSPSDAAKKLWEDPILRAKLSKLSAERATFERMSAMGKKAWSDPVYRERKLDQMAEARSMSKMQTRFYEILYDMGLSFYPKPRDDGKYYSEDEPKIGFYRFDCLIPRKDSTNLLLEFNSYHHTLEENIRRDASKIAYIKNNFAHEYEVKTLWEHELLNCDRIKSLILYWLGRNSLKIKDFKFHDLVLKDIDKIVAADFFGKYHYTGGLGRNAKTYGFYYGSDLVCAAAFAAPVRQNVNIKGCERSKVRELTRFCIRPDYQKRNLASFALSRFIKKLEQLNKYELLITYADSTFNHYGIIYKATNWIQDGIVKPSHWYVDPDGFVMHKKTLYNAAHNIHMKEPEFAKKYNYKKVHGDKKIRFIKWLSKSKTV